MALNVAKEVAALERMSVNDLCERHRETFGEETNARNKRWLVKRIAAIAQDWRTPAKCNYATNGIFCFRSN